MLRYGYKLRFYQLSGPDKGNLSNEEFFQDQEQMMTRYREYSDGICMRITRLPGSMWITSGHGSPCECPGEKHGHDQLLSCWPRRLGQGYGNFIQKDAIEFGVLF